MITECRQCATCKHFQKDGTCPAFPELVAPPLDILDMHVDHRNPYPGDHGIRWEPREPGIKHPLDEMADHG